MRRWRDLLLVLCLVSGTAAIPGCGNAVRFEAETPGTYTVRHGDTLYSIAVRNDIDWRELARINGIRAPYTLEVGRKLRLTPDAKATVAGRPQPGTKAGTPRPPPRPVQPPPTSKFAWVWPSDGKLVAQFKAGSASEKGIDIAGERGSEVRAAFDGKVVYVGSGLVGYGRVIIVKHDDRYLSAYAHNDRFLVGEGATVKRGQPIAAMGLGPGQHPLLHFEIRLDGRAIDPLPMLPKR